MFDERPVLLSAKAQVDVDAVGENKAHADVVVVAVGPDPSWQEGNTNVLYVTSVRAVKQ